MRFEENQRLNFWWLYILIGIETIITLTLVLYTENGTASNRLQSIAYLPFWLPLLLFGLVYLINKSEFHLKIDEKGVEYRYWPFVTKKNISWQDIDAAYLRKYDALGEYGGWGVRNRLWFRFRDKAYLFNDQPIGLQLELANEKRVLFSTEKTEELTLFLANLREKFEIKALNNDGRER